MLPQAMVVLASEQPWPNIQGLVHWHKHGGGLKDLCIYYTDDEQRSAGPARRFATLAQKLIPPLEVHLLEGAGGRFPKDVIAQLKQWHQELPNRRWIINATGGLKLMFAGVLQGIDLPNTEIVYREIGGEWFSITKSDHGLEVHPLSVDLSVTDDIPVEYLVQAQSPVAAGREWVRRAPRPLPIVDIVRHAIDTKWNWQKSFRRAGIFKKAQPGHLFERFVAAVLLELGIKQVDLNAHLVGQNQQSFQEIDVIANYRGRILIFDCKLRTKEEEGSRVEKLTSQIRQAATIRRDIGGAGAKLLMIRPGRKFRPSEKQLAQALQLDVLDSPSTMDFFRRIADFCEAGPNLPPKIAEAQELLDKARGQGELEAFARSPFLPTSEGKKPRVRKERPTRENSFLPTSEGGEPQRAVIRLDTHFIKYVKMLNQDWAIFTLFDKSFLYLRLPHKWAPEALQAKLQEIFGPYATVGFPEISKGKRSAFAQLLECDQEKLEIFLSQFVGKSLWGDKAE